MNVNPDQASGGQQQEQSFNEDATLPDRSDEIMEVFGLSADWPEELDKSSKPRNAAEDQGGQAGEAPAAGSPSVGGGEGETPQGQGGQSPAASTNNQGEGGSQTQAQPGQQSAQQQAAPQAATPSSPASPTTQQPAAQQPAAPDPRDAELATLRAQVQALTQHLTQPQGGQQQQPGTSPGGTQAPAQGQPPAEDLSQYNLGIPQDVLSAISDAENPQMYAAGMHHLINSLASTVHKRVLQHTEQVIEQRLSGYSQQQSVATQQQKMQEEYYSAFPQHNNAATKLIVAQEATAMWAAQPGLAWDEQSRNALGARVNARLGIAAQPAQQPQPQAQPQAGTQAPAAPAAQMGATNRPAQTGGDFSDEITAVLG